MKRRLISRHLHPQRQHQQQPHPKEWLLITQLIFCAKHFPPPKLELYLWPFAHHERHTNHYPTCLLGVKHVKPSAYKVSPDADILSKINEILKKILVWVRIIFFRYKTWMIPFRQKHVWCPLLVNKHTKIAHSLRYCLSCSSSMSIIQSHKHCNANNIHQRYCIDLYSINKISN